MLHNHSAYSVIDGRATIEDYLHLVEQDKQEFFALTDHGTLGSAIELYTQTKKHNIKPIIGCELYIDALELKERNYPAHLTVLARNEAGYRALIAANNLAHRQFYYRPRLTLRQIIDNNFAQDWIVLSGCMSSLFFDYPQAEAETMVKQLAAHSGRFFLEVMWHQSDDVQFLPKQQMYLERVAALQKATGLPLALTNDCHYATLASENIHHEVLSNSREPSGLEFDGVGFHFKTLQEMETIARDQHFGAALDNAVAAAKECNIVIPEADSLSWYVPDITNGQPYQRVRSLCEYRLKDAPTAYRQRFEYEMSVLARSPAILNSYLVAHDVIDWCVGRNIPAAARGSMAGSIVSWLLGITTEDPVRYNLKFERAVNPARPTIPDFDLDVSSSRRGEVLEYLKTRYQYNIPICAYTHYGPKGALRKILRMEGLRDQQTINGLCRELPEDWADGDFEYSPSGKTWIGKAEWSTKLPQQYVAPVAIYQGLYSTMSVHPSGIIISGPERPPENEIPLQWIASSKTLVSAFDMYTLKKIGLFKLDVLGLRTLDQLDAMKRFSGGAEAPDGHYDEDEVLAAFSADLLAGIFQMDGYACREVIRAIRGIGHFEDIVAANTLARPGAKQFTNYYRTGLQDIMREYPELAPVLGYTNGLILYQEQVMEIAQVLADFNDAEQDDIKEAIKYFRHEEFAQTIAPLFEKRCSAKGIDATNILQRIMQFSKYTFNRAHAMTYAAIAYKMMWYKVHHPAAYYAAVFDATEDRPRLILESHFFKVEWQIADINQSDYTTTVQGNKILLGLGAIKGVGFESYKAVAAARPYTSFADFEARVTKGKCNVRTRANLRDAYALASLGEQGSPVAFQEAFSFSYNCLDGEQLKRMETWQQAEHGRAAGYVVGLWEYEVKNGSNAGRKMAKAEIVNSQGKRKVVFWPDVWYKARGALYEGAAVALVGRQPTQGDMAIEYGISPDSLP